MGVSGSLFCYIRGAPLYGFEQRGLIRIFADQGRDQYGIEGKILEEKLYRFQIILSIFNFFSYLLLYL